VAVGRARRLAPLSGALLWVLVGGCARAPAAQADAVLARYAEALARSDVDGARALVTPGDRAALSREAFAAALAASPREAAELSAALGRAAPARVEAVVVLDDGSEVRLEVHEDGFAIVDPLTRFYAQSSPRAAQLSFVRAVARSRWDVLWALMPSEAREGLDPAGVAARFAAAREDLTRVAARLATAREAPIEVVGDRATMPYGERYTARFVREEGVWKVEDPD